MADRIKPVTWETLVRKLHDLGFNGPFIGGKHHCMTEDELRLTIPNPHAGDINVAL